MTAPDVTDPDAANYTADDDDNGGDGDQEHTVTVTRQHLRTLEKAAKQGRRDSAQLAELRQSQAFTDAGLVLNDTQRKAFDNAYEGDFSTESLQQFATDMGWQVTAPPSEDAQDLAALDRVTASTAGQAAPPPALDMNAQLRAAAGRPV